MKPSHYHYTSCLNVHLPSIINHVCFLTNRIAKITKTKSIARELRTNVNCSTHGQIAANIILNAKTHKPKGQASLRVAHACHSYPFFQLGWWIIQQIVNNTKDFIANNRKVTIEPSDMLVKADVEITS